MPVMRSVFPVPALVQILYTTNVQFLEILLSPPPTLSLPLEGGGVGGGEFWLRLRRAV